MKSYSLCLLAALALGACGESPTTDAIDDTDEVLDTDVVDVGEPPAVVGASPVLRRLTVSQYDHALRDLFGADIYVPVAPEPDLRLEGSARVGAGQVSVSPRGVERFEKAAYVVAEQVISAERRDSWMPCTPEGAEDAVCAADAITSLGHLVWRRPLTETEVTALTDVVMNAAAVLSEEPDVTEPFYAGMAYGVAGLLQSPDFLMAPEFGDGTGTERTYTGLEMATRLSLFLWDSVPDEDLLLAAEAGDLDDLQGLTAQVDRMIEDPRARRGLRAWTDDLLNLSEVLNLQKDPEVFVFLRDGFFESSREETLRVVEDVVFDRDADIGEMLTTRRTYLDRTLAMVYGVQAPVREGFGLAELPEDGGRVGLFGHASFLSLYAHPRSSSATKRGQFVRQTLLCGEPLSAPANVDTSIPEPSPEAPTLRDRIASHLEVPACRACHASMDPIGLGFENFDGMGVYRTTEGGAEIDASGDVDGANYADLAELAAVVRSHEDFMPCLVNNVTRSALGRSIADSEAEAMSWLIASFNADQHRFKALWRNLAISPMFRSVGEVAE